MLSLKLSFGEKRICLFCKNKQARTLRSFFAFFIFALCTFLFASCTKPKSKQSENALSETPAENEVNTEQERICWFAFGNSSLQEFASLDEFPKVAFVPWTEAKNVSGITLLVTPFF
ncbi:MAG: hypothetical protein P1P64_07870 [Treponemataceae bacterium]